VTSCRRTTGSSRHVMQRELYTFDSVGTPSVPLLNTFDIKSNQAIVDSWLKRWWIRDWVSQT
jgi:hypothetical protein